MIKTCARFMLGQEGGEESLSSEIVQLLTQARKPGTVYGHALVFRRWKAYAAARGAPALPANPLMVTNFLIETARNDVTASPTLNRSRAIAFFTHLAGTPNPMNHPLCKSIKEGLHRKLGIRGIKKAPLLYHQVAGLIQNHVHTSREDQMVCLLIAIMYEGCLRWSDIAQMTFGDIVITPTFMRLFIEQAKTDADRLGQWVTIAASGKEGSAWNLLVKCIKS
jgi:hypothetical protein